MAVIRPLLSVPRICFEKGLGPRKEAHQLDITWSSDCYDRRIVQSQNLDIANTDATQGHRVEMESERVML